MLIEFWKEFFRTPNDTSHLLHLERRPTVTSCMFYLNYHCFKGEGADDVDVQQILAPGTGVPVVQAVVEVHRHP